MAFNCLQVLPFCCQPSADFKLTKLNVWVSKNLLIYLLLFMIKTSADISESLAAATYFLHSRKHLSREKEKNRKNIVPVTNFVFLHSLM
jgi:hypothetical protein